MAPWLGRPVWAVTLQMAVIALGLTSAVPCTAQDSADEQKAIAKTEAHERTQLWIPKALDVLESSCMPEPSPTCIRCYATLGLACPFRHACSASIPRPRSAGTDQKRNVALLIRLLGCPSARWPDVTLPAALKRSIFKVDREEARWAGLAYTLPVTAGFSRACAVAEG